MGINIDTNYYIFLDIDGVLNKESDWKKGLYYLNKECLNNFLLYLNKVKNFKIVIISTWRNGDGIKELEKYFPIYDKTPNSNKDRQAEVEYYIKRNNITKYIVIDDDISLYHTPESVNIYIPDYRTGLTMNDINKLFKKIRLNTSSLVICKGECYEP